MTDTKATVTRLVTEVMNRRDLDLLHELCTPQLAPKLRRASPSAATPEPSGRIVPARARLS